MYEIFIEIPSNLEARSLTWSTYKHHNTIKFLIGITPHGTISFLSKAWVVLATNILHVERVIGLLRQKYSILAETMPIDYLLVNDGYGTTTVDKIAIVCSALINMSARIVPTD